MADNYAICTLLGAMDNLWFHQIILFSQPITLVSPKSPQPTLESVSSSQSSSCTSFSDPAEEYTLSDEPALGNDSETEERKKIITEVLEKTRPSRLNSIKARSQSSSPSPTPNKHSKKSKRYSGSVMRLQKSMSCKSLSELEVEEVKGFMDLGFRFDAQHLCPRMMTVVPGLQRLGGTNNNVEKDKFFDELQAITEKLDDENVKNKVGVDEDEKEKRLITRPYLSEAWLIRRPDSPLLNLRIPKASAAADMKKHLKCWARTVATVIQQES